MRRVNILSDIGEAQGVWCIAFAFGVNTCEACFCLTVAQRPRRKPRPRHTKPRRSTGHRAQGCVVQVDTSTSGELQWGTGGMTTKLTAARIATAAACSCLICSSSSQTEAIPSIVGGKRHQAGTLFHPLPNAVRFVTMAAHPCTLLDFCGFMTHSRNNAVSWTGDSWLDTAFLGLSLSALAIAL